MAQNEFKALVFHEIAVLHREIAEVRAPKLRKTELDTESTNSGSAASCGGFSSASADDEVFATPLSEQPPQVRALLASAVALVNTRTWTRSACQRYYAALRQHREEEPLQPARVETLSFLQLQELCGKLQIAPPADFKGMPTARAAIARKCAGVTGYFVSCYLAEQTARSLEFLAAQEGVLGSGAVVRHVIRGVVNTAMVTAPCVFYDRQDGRTVMSLSYKVVSLDDEGFGYAKKIQTVLVPLAPPVPARHRRRARRRWGRHARASPLSEVSVVT